MDSEPNPMGNLVTEFSSDGESPGTDNDSPEGSRGTDTDNPHQEIVTPSAGSSPESTGQAIDSPAQGRGVTNGAQRGARKDARQWKDQLWRKALQMAPQLRGMDSVHEMTRKTS